MYLVDTSVWIDYFREKDNATVKKLDSIFNKGHRFGITSAIYQEILQGANTEQDTYLKTQRFYHPVNPLKTHQAAAHLYFTCRRNGITVRSSIDCLIAQLAIENHLILLHNDKDF
jgi:hypothetical protein